MKIAPLAIGAAAQAAITAILIRVGMATPKQQVIAGLLWLMIAAIAQVVSSRQKLSRRKINSSQ